MQLPPDSSRTRGHQTRVTTKHYCIESSWMSAAWVPPDAHKTAAIFGPSRTAVPAAACALLQAWLTAAGLTTSTAAAKPYVFVLGNPARGAVDHSKALDARRWTEVVQAVLKRQAGVAFAPKDLRSSFITFLMSDANSDEALKKAVATPVTAMRHSTTLQGSATYDKERAERTWASAVRRALRVRRAREARLVPGPGEGVGLGDGGG